MKSIETFYNLLNERFGVNDNRGKDSLFYTETYNEFNKMQNNENIQ